MFHFLWFTFWFSIFHIESILSGCFSLDTWSENQVAIHIIIIRISVAINCHLRIHFRFFKILWYTCFSDITCTCCLDSNLSLWSALFLYSDSPVLMASSLNCCMTSMEWLQYVFLLSDLWTGIETTILISVSFASISSIKNNHTKSTSVLITLSVSKFYII